VPRQPTVFKPRSVKAPQHNARGNEATNRQRRRAMHTGSKGWRLQRERVLVRDGYMCQWPGCGCYGDQVDHRNDNADEHVTDDELWTLCIRHHSSKTRTEQNKHR
jgi:5-methylcytosine-specific restriction protein A